MARNENIQESFKSFIHLLKYVAGETTADTFTIKSLIVTSTGRHCPRPSRDINRQDITEQRVKSIPIRSQNPLGNGFKTIGRREKMTKTEDRRRRLIFSLETGGTASRASGAEGRWHRTKLGGLPPPEPRFFISNFDIIKLFAISHFSVSCLTIVC